MATVWRVPLCALAIGYAGFGIAVPSLGWSAVVATAMLASFYDVSTLKIPNWLTYSSAGWAIAGSTFATVAIFGAASVDWIPLLSVRRGLVTIDSALMGLLLCFLAMLLVYLLGMQGAGDVKLAAAIGGWIGWRAGLNVILVAFLVAGSVALIVAILRLGPLRLAGWLLEKVEWRIFGHGIVSMHLPSMNETQEAVLKRPVPFALAMLAGVLIVLSTGNLV